MIFVKDLLNWLSSKFWESLPGGTNPGTFREYRARKAYKPVDNTQLNELLQKASRPPKGNPRDN